MLEKFQRIWQVTKYQTEMRGNVVQTKGEKKRKGGNWEDNNFPESLHKIEGSHTHWTTWASFINLRIINPLINEYQRKRRGDYIYMTWPLWFHHLRERMKQIKSLRRQAIIFPHFEEGRSASTLYDICKIRKTFRLSSLWFPQRRRSGCRDTFYISYLVMAIISPPHTALTPK